MNSRSLVIGYHGCDLKLAKRLAAGGINLAPSRNLYDWLGNGQYIWEYSLERGWQWALEAAKDGRIKTPAVVGIVVDLGNCLDLVDAEALQIVRDAYQRYQQLCQLSGSNEERNRGPGFRARYLDCMVFETLHAWRQEQGLPPFDTVRGFFVEGSELYPGAGLRDRDHIQICVRNPQCIKGYFLPKN
ncbi:MAG: hypothetical protein ACKVY0_29995 [Prosthecobacter sp.]|uniref:hypothetical protein n=1 Tax=Prosthecobacter sp. TaxID=1965333 RepID=UPI0038FFE576